MTFKKTNLKTWKAHSKNLTFYIDKETIDNFNYIYILTILDGIISLGESIAFYKLNTAKQYAKQY